MKVLKEMEPKLISNTQRSHEKVKCQTPIMYLFYSNTVVFSFFNLIPSQPHVMHRCHWEGKKDMEPVIFIETSNFPCITLK